MAKIGIYGGTFNPIHNGHLYIARAAKDQLNLDEIWWVVSGNPPHKDQEILSRIERFEMCCNSLEDQEGMKVKDFELYRLDECYTYELLESLKKHFAEHQFFFIMGEDSLNQFCDWVNPNRIAEAADLVVAARDDGSIKNLEQTAQEIRKKFQARVHLLKTKEMPISSTEIRKRAAKGKEIENLVPKAAKDYIMTRGLYTEHETSFDFVGICEKLKKKLKSSRYRHTIGVMETAANLAMRYRMPIEKLRIAGLLHDCAKCYDNKELLALCKKYGLTVTHAQKASPHLLHAKVGAYLAEHEYGITDSEIINAILAHTTGSCDMSLTAQILFVADYIEPNRSFRGRLDEIRQMAYVDLDVCTLMIIENTLEFIEKKNDPIDETTIDTYEFYKKKVKKKIIDKTMKR